MKLRQNYIILTHGHGDHIGDTFKIANRCNPLFICVDELANIVPERGHNAHNMHIGGCHVFEFGKVKFTIAHHGSMTRIINMPVRAAGVIISVDDKIFIIQVIQVCSMI